MKRQVLPYIWIVGLPVTIWGCIQGLLLVLSVKLPNYPSNPRIRTCLLLSWLIVTMIELVMAIIFAILIFTFIILVGKHVYHNIVLKYVKDLQVY